MEAVWFPPTSSFDLTSGTGGRPNSKGLVGLLRKAHRIDGTCGAVAGELAAKVLLISQHPTFSKVRSLSTASGS
jgi:hypothetical protein